MGKGLLGMISQNRFEHEQGDALHRELDALAAGQQAESAEQQNPEQQPWRSLEKELERLERKGVTEPREVLGRLARGRLEGEMRELVSFIPSLGKFRCAW